MSLTQDDLRQIQEINRSTIIEAIDELVSPRFDALEEDVAVLKTDVAELKTDVAELKTDVRILKDEMRGVKISLQSLEGKVAALEADVRELYVLQAQMAAASITDKKFSKLSLEKKILKLNAELLSAAHEAGITLPR